MTDRPIASQGANDLVDTEFLRALRNDTADFGLWPVRFDIPAGWRHTGFIGDFPACVAYVRALDGVSGIDAPEGPLGALAGRIGVALHRWGTSAALTDGSGTTSYADLDDGRATVARGLRELGIVAGEPVAVPTAPARAYLAALTGVVCHGALPVSGPAVAAVDEALVVTRGAGGVAVAGSRPVGVLAAEWGELLLDDAAVCAQLDRTVVGRIRPTDRVALLDRPGGWRHTLELWSALTRGACIVVADGAAGERGVAVPDGRVTVLVADPDVVRRARDLAALRLVVSDGPLDGPTRMHLGGRGVEVVEVRAHAAASGIVAERAPGRALWRPVAPGATYVLGPDMAAVAPGEEGRLFVGGTTVVRLRRREPVVALRHFLPDPFAADGSRMVAVGEALSAERAHDHGTAAFRTSSSTPEPTTEERT